MDFKKRLTIFGFRFITNANLFTIFFISCYIIFGATLFSNVNVLIDTIMLYIPFYGSALLLTVFRWALLMLIILLYFLSFVIVVNLLITPKRARRFFKQLQQLKGITKANCPHLIENKLNRKNKIRTLEFFTQEMPFGEWVDRQAKIEGLLDVTIVKPIVRSRDLWDATKTTNHRVTLYVTYGKTRGKMNIHINV